jgi:hypothetical protein
VLKSTGLSQHTDIHGAPPRLEGEGQLVESNYVLKTAVRLDV